MLTALVVILGEIRKSLLVAWTYRVNSLATVLTVGFIFVGIVFLMGRGELRPETVSFTLVGYLTWFYATGVISDLSYGLRGEIQAGTLEQTSMSPAPLGLILIARSIGHLLIGTVQVALLGGALVLLLKAPLPLRWAGLPVLAITLFGAFGFGLVVAGVVLMVKQADSFINLLQNMLAFLNGTMLPVDAMPGWMAAFARTLPTTQGVVVLRRVLLDGASLASTWQDHSLLWLLVHSAAYFAVGWGVFALCMRTAKEQGSLGQY